MVTKKEQVIKLHEEGKSVAEITKLLGMNHSNNVYAILSKYKLENELKALRNK